MYGLVLKERCGADGLKKDDVMEMIDLLESNEFFPIELSACCCESSALGFITADAANLVDYDYENSGLHSYIASILDDMHNENEDCKYEFKGIKIWMSR